MGAYYDEIEIEDMVWDDDKGVFHYPCPCGDRFEITRKQLANYEDIAMCPGCSLVIRIIYDPLDFEDDTEDEDEEEAETDSETTDVEEDDLSAQQERMKKGKEGSGESDADDESFGDALENLHLDSKNDTV